MDCLNAEVQLIGDAIQRQAGLDLQLPHVCDFLGWVYAADRPDRSSTGAFFRSVPSYRFVRAPLLPVEGGLAPARRPHFGPRFGLIWSSPRVIIVQWFAIGNVPQGPSAM